MFKNKFKMVAILVVLILAITIPIARAENETPTTIATPDVTTTSEEASNEAIVTTNDNPEVTTSTEDNFKKSDVYLSGNDVTVDYIVDGNLFVFANNVTINSQIGGDAFIFANSVTIGEQGYIHSNLFTFSKNITINGVIGDLYTASENTTITGYVCRDVHIASEVVNLSGVIRRDAYISCSTLTFLSNTNENKEDQATLATQPMIQGNLNYSAKTETTIPEGIVTGETTFEQQESFDTNIMQERIINLLTFVATIVAVWLVCLWLAPKFLKNSASLLTTKKIGPVILFGLLTPIAIVLLTIVFFLLGITSTLGLLLLMILFTLITISTSIFAITLNTIICHQLKIEKTLATFGMLVATSIVLWLIGLIPIIGSLLGLIVVVLGLGIILSSIMLKEKTIA